MPQAKATVQKVEDKKVSGEKKTPAPKKPRAKKVETAEEVVTPTAE
jgi:hypothetical protein